MGHAPVLARVIGVDLSQDAYRTLDHAEVPSPWAFLIDRVVAIGLDHARAVLATR